MARCSFAGYTGIWVDGLTAGRLTVGGARDRQNVFDTYVAGCDFSDNSNSEIAVVHNRMSCSAGESIWCQQGWASAFASAVGGAPVSPPPLPAPRYLICDNAIAATGYAGGIFLWDNSLTLGVPGRLHAVIADNHISLDNAGYDAGVDGFAVQGVLVCRNRISGTGLAGIDVGTDWWQPFNEPAGGWKIVDNDVSGLTATGDQYGIPTAQIWLGPDADHCLVVGGCSPTTVLDQGTSDTLINVTSIAEP